MNADRENSVRWWDLPAAMILLVAVFLAAVRLNATNWTEELVIVQTITFFAVLSGLALGQSAFSPRAAGWFSAAYGVFVVFWLLGLTFGEGIEWLERTMSLFGRLGVSVENLVRQRAVTDPIMFLFIISVLFWILSAHAGFTLTRYANAWRATLPMGLALFIIHIHDPFWNSRSWFLAGYIFLALLLLSRINFLVKRQGWRETRTHMPPFVGLDFLRTTMIVGGLLIIFAWTAPAMAANLPPAQEAWQRIARPWYEARARMTSAFASLRATVGVVQDYYGDVLPLGRGNTLTDVIVFAVEAPPRPAAGVRYYWRARAYEIWTGSGWQADPTDIEKIQPGESTLILPNLSGRWEADFVFYPQTSLTTIYVAPQPQWVSRPATADLLVMEDGTAEILRLTTTPAIRPGETYMVHSSLTNVTEAQLRAAGTDYPDFIADRYLGMPDTITRRTRELAEEITAPYDNPYDKVEAITQWLRDSITYQETVPVPPQDQDIIDWMLFDLKAGFCNYYATAEVIMLRSLGIPSRLAVGYAQGQRDPETNIYTVRQADAHAWPEVYFPGIGWVEFEPTLNQRPLRRPPGDPINENDSASPALGIDNSSFEQLERDELLAFDLSQADAEAEEDQADSVSAITQAYLPWLATGGVLALIAGAYTWYRSRVFDPVNPMTPLSLQVEQRIQRSGWRTPRFIRRMAASAGLPLEARAYEQINRSLRRLGQTPEISQTPAERGRLLAVLLPLAHGPIQDLLDAYQNTMYGTANGASGQDSRAAALTASRAVRNETYLIYLRRFLQRFQEPARREPLV